MRIHAYQSKVWLPRPIEEVFAFFAEARNLRILTPPSLRFEIVTPGKIDMAAGTLIDYRLRVHGVPIFWQSEITIWDPPLRFVDEQRRGPYLLWVHEHRFTEKDGGTLAMDHVRYAVFGGAMVNRLFVSRDIERIFEFRATKLKEIFPSRPGDAPVRAGAP